MQGASFGKGGMLSPMVRCTYHVVGGGSRRYPRKVLRSLVGRGWALVEEPMPLHRPSLLRRFPHHPIVVLGVLVVVLGFDGVSGQGGSTREFHVLRVARLGIDTSIRLLPGRP